MRQGPKAPGEADPALGDTTDTRGARPPEGNSGLGGALQDVMGTLIHGDNWPEARERQARIAEEELKTAQRKATLDRVGTSFAIVVLTCLTVLAIAGTVWFVQQILG